MPVDQIDVKCEYSPVCSGAVESSRPSSSCAEYLAGGWQPVRRTSCYSTAEHHTTPHHSSQYKQMEQTQLGLLL